jgi:hypothetical protein
VKKQAFKALELTARFDIKKCENTWIDGVGQVPLLGSLLFIWIGLLVYGLVRARGCKWVLPADSLKRGPMIGRRVAS